jgi:hypothetical protein
MLTQNYQYQKYQKYLTMEESLCCSSENKSMRMQTAYHVDGAPYGMK